MTRLWSSLALPDRSISTQFLITAGIVLCLTMAVLGTWVNEQIKHSVLVTSGAQATNFMTGFLEPRVQDLLPDGSLTEARKRELDALFIGTPLGTTVVSIKIWRADGLVLYSTTKELIGQKFVSTDVGKAATGQIVAEYEDLISQESAYEQTLDMALIEVYAPLYRNGTKEVLAVGEIYENADALAAELTRSQMTTWLMVALTTLFMIGVLYLIVRRGASTIAEQRAELADRYDEAQRLARQNAELRDIADSSRLSASEANEQFLGRVGSDIHDGPIQLLTLATLRLTALIRSIRNGRAAPQEEEIEGTIAITQEALAELRNISTGLSLPEIDEMSLEETIRLAIFRHEDLTAEKVDHEPATLPKRVTEALKICVYRVIQEALTNATKHAPGARKHVAASWSGREVVVEVVDHGPGIPPPGATDDRPHLGISGMRNRVGALNGRIEIGSGAEGGTRVTVYLPLEGQVGDA